MMTRFGFSFLHMTAACMFISGCTTIELVSKYDDQTDKAATEMQKDVTAFFVEMRTALTEKERSFSESQDFYRKQAVSISSMQVRANNIPKNTITQQQLQLVENQLATLALMHKGCLRAQPGTTPAQLDELEARRDEAITEKGMDPSIACRTEFGAYFDDPDRGSHAVDPDYLQIMEGQLSSTLGAVMKLEIAKKRGE